MKTTFTALGSWRTSSVALVVGGMLLTTGCERREEESIAPSNVSQDGKDKENGLKAYSVVSLQSPLSLRFCFTWLHPTAGTKSSRHIAATQDRAPGAPELDPKGFRETKEGQRECCTQGSEYFEAYSHHS